MLLELYNLFLNYPKEDFGIYFIDSYIPSYNEVAQNGINRESD